MPNSDSPESRFKICANCPNVKLFEQVEEALMSDKDVFLNLGNLGLSLLAMADCDKPRPVEIGDEHLLFCGNPNADAVESIFAEVAARARPTNE